MSQLIPCDIDVYTQRSACSVIERIPEARLPDLGYISARTIRKESKERQWLVDKLLKLAGDLRRLQNPSVLHVEWLTEKMRRQIECHT